MTSRKFLLFFPMCLFLFVSVPYSFAIPLDTAVEEQLSSDNEFVQYHFDNEKPAHIPRTAMFDNVKERYDDMDITVGVEVYFSIPSPPGFTNSESDQVALYNILHNISHLKGTEYYSVRRKRMRIFFKQAYLIDDINSTEPLADPIFAAIPEHDSRTIFQEDSTFGENISEAVYTWKDHVFSMEITNLTPMKYFIPVVDPGGSVMTLQILPQEDRIIFYGVIGVDTISMFGLEKAKKESFYNRLKAMYSWFQSELGKEYP